MSNIFRPYHYDYLSYFFFQKIDFDFLHNISNYKSFYRVILINAPFYHDFKNNIIV